MTKFTSTTEIPYIHYVRVIACIEVLVLHCTHGIPNENSLFTSILHCIAQPCVPLFFMITGALILPPPSEGMIMGIYKKRIPKVLFPLLIWGVVYSVLPFFLSNSSVKSVIYNVLCIPLCFPNEYGRHLWYLYVLIGIYLFLPFLSRKIYEDQKMIFIYMAIWLISSFCFVLHIPFPELFGESKWINTYSTVHYFSGYFGYMLLGYVLHHNFMCSEKTVKNTICLDVCKWLLAFFLCYVVRQQLFDIDLGPQKGWYIFPTSVLFSYYTFKLLKNIRINKTFTGQYVVVKHISKYSFGIYLIHMVLYHTITMPYIYAISSSWLFQMASILITFSMSYLLCIVISKFPGSKYVIGI